MNIAIIINIIFITSIIHMVITGAPRYGGAGAAPSAPSAAGGLSFTRYHQIVDVHV